VEQARLFQEAVGVDGVFLAKLDGTAKGGVTVAIAQQLRLPVVFIGTGEGTDDLTLFDTDDFVDALFGDNPHRALKRVPLPSRERGPDGAARSLPPQERGGEGA